MMNRNRLLNKYLLLAVIFIAMLAMSGCRTRITNNNEVSNVYYDEDGFLTETYQMRRDELGLSTAEKPILPDLGSGDTEDDFDSAEDSNFNYEPEEDNYVEPPTTNTTNNRTGTRGRTSTTGSGTGTSTSTKKVKIYLHGEGGTIDGKKKLTMEVEKNKTTTLPGKNSSTGSDKVKRKGYKFVGWSKKPEGKTIDFSFKAKENTNLYAVWKEDNGSNTDKEKIVITFKGNGGTPETTKVEVNEGSIIINNAPKELKAPEGKEFNGWYTSATGGDALKPTDKANKEAKSTYYAQWKDKDEKPEVKEYNISFDVLDDQKTENGKIVLQTPSKDGYDFLYWKDEDGNTYEAGEITPTKDLSLKAVWDNEKHWKEEFDKETQSLDKEPCISIDAGDILGACKGEPSDDEEAKFVIAVVKDDKVAETFSSLTNEEKYNDKTIIVVSKKYDDELPYLIKVVNIIHPGTIEEESKALDELGGIDSDKIKIREK